MGTSEESDTCLEPEKNTLQLKIVNLDMENSI